MEEHVKLGNLVRDIQAGNEAAFADLYEATQNYVFFRTRNYLDRGSNAMWIEDAVQETYIKAFRYLKDLKEPNAVKAWLGRITDSVCLNLLKKNNKGETASIDDEDRFDVVLEADESVMPDKVVDRQGTSDIVAEMIEKLPAEQRITLMYYYYDLLPVKEIAARMDCSEGTVKSRLKYARDNIEKQVLAEEKRGVKLYSLSPAMLFLVFSRMEKGTVMPDGMSQLLAQRIAEGCGYAAAGGGAAAAGTAAAGTSATGAATVGTTAAKVGFLHTVAGKVVAGILGVALIGGAVVGGTQLMNRGQEEPTQETVEEVIEPEAEAEPEVEEEPEEEPEEAVFTDVADEEYSQLLAGGLSKEELETALAGILDPVNQQEMNDQEVGLFAIMVLGSGNSMPISEMNRYLSTLAPNWVINDSTVPAWQDLGYYIEGDQFGSIDEFNEEPHGDGSNPRSASITRAQVKDDVLFTEYEYTGVEFEYTGDDPMGTPRQYTEERTAVFTKNDDGKFILQQIYQGNYREGSEGEALSMPAWKTAYAEILQQAGSGGEYALYEMDMDRIPELLIYSETSDDYGVYGQTEVYTYVDGAAVLAGTVEGTGDVAGGFAASRLMGSSNGLTMEVLDRMNGESSYSDYSLIDGKLEDTTLSLERSFSGTELRWVSTAPPYDTLNNY